MFQKAYKFRFYPNAQQRQQLAIDFGCARFVWNIALDARGLAYRALGRSENYVGLNRAMNELKADPDYTWLKDANSAVLTQALIDQDKAFRNFFEGRAKYPKFKKKHQSQSVRYTLDQRNIDRNYNAKDGLLRLPKMGALKIRWSRMPGGIPKMATVSLDGCGRYHISFACEVEVIPLPSENQAIGADLGLASIATLSDGTKVMNSRWTRKFERKLRHAQRELSRRVKGSHRWLRTKRKVAKIHAKIKACREWCMHDVTTRIVRNFGTICLEDLNVKALCRALRLGKSMADAALGEFVRQIEYKAAWYGRRVIKIGRYDRSTGVCPDCGVIGPKLHLRIRDWRCECGARHDRDIAAAQVILQVATAERAGIARGVA